MRFERSLSFSEPEKFRYHPVMKSALLHHYDKMLQRQKRRPMWFRAWNGPESIVSGTPKQVYENMSQLRDDLKADNADFMYWARVFRTPDDNTDHKTPKTAFKDALEYLDWLIGKLEKYKDNEEWRVAL